MLGSIFECLVASVRSDPEMRFRTNWTEVPQNQWLHVNLVCGHWRRVALSYPSLWTCIYFGALGNTGTEGMANRLSDMSLHRSGSLPLTGYFARGSATVLHWAKHIRRFRELHITIPQNIYATPDTRPSVWAQETPLLEVLIVRNSQTSKFDSSLTGNPSRRTWRLPHLRTLIWEGRPDPRPGVFGNLRRLVLHHTSAHSVESLLETLANNPLLEELIINGLHFLDLRDIRRAMEDPAWVQMLPKANLPVLKRLSIEEAGFPEQCWLLCRKLVQRRGLIRSFSFSMNEELLDFDSLKIAEDSGDHADRLYVDRTRLVAYNDNSVWSFYDINTSYGDDGVPAQMGPCSYANFEGFIRMLARSQPIRELWLSIETQPARPHIYQELWLSTQAREPGRGAWIDGLESLRDVERLVVVSDERSRSWIDILAEHPNALPSLKHIQLDMADLLRPPVESIVKLLIARMSTPCPIQSLHIVKTVDDMDPMLTPAVLDSYVDSLTMEFVDSEESREPIYRRMKLPEAFTSPSPVHAYWDGWTGPPPSCPHRT
ncbi:hypothetical protein BC629DRAFT_161994 [Irpex lacteus]|nr:hypothetical protein BC629DRAFT_161994 [Irpex lacteus]